MATLKVGYNVFAGTSQAGTDAGIPGEIQAETAVAGKYKVRVQRLSDNNYWNNTSGAFQAGATAEADELDFRGSDSDRGITSAIRRLRMRLPQELLDDVTSAGLIVYVYETGGSPTTYVQVNYLP
jgi:hypothetical protein